MSNEKQREPKYPRPNLPAPENNLPITDDNLPAEAAAHVQPVPCQCKADQEGNKYHAMYCPKHPAYRAPSPVLTAELKIDVESHRRRDFAAMVEHGSEAVLTQPSADLKAEWMAQDKILDYTNWLHSELLKARASAPAVAPTQQVVCHKCGESFIFKRDGNRLIAIVRGHNCGNQEALVSQQETLSILARHGIKEAPPAPAVAGRTQGDVSALQVIEALERGGGLTADQEKLIEKFRRQIAGSAREAPSGLLPRSDQQLIIKALATLQVTSPVESADHTAAKALLLKVTKSLRSASPEAPQPYQVFGLTYATRNIKYSMDAEMFNLLRDYRFKGKALEAFQEGIKAGRIVEAPAAPKEK